MNDQAQRLRQIVQQLHCQRTEKDKRPARIITITSGKGGVGKSNFTVNLGMALQSFGYRVLILDADFGLANVDVLLGMTPRYNLSHVIHCSKSIADVVADGPGGIKLISGGSGMQELVNLQERHLDKFISGMQELEELADVILIDTGAGISDQVVKMVLSSTEVILITTPEPTSIMDGYALVKVIAGARQQIHIRLVVNKAESVREGEEILENFTRVARTFLKMELEQLGYILFDPVVGKAVRQQAPFICSHPRSAASRSIHKIAQQLMDMPAVSTGGYVRGNSIRNFFQRFVKL